MNFEYYLCRVFFNLFKNTAYLIVSLYDLIFNKTLISNQLAKFLKF